MADRIVLSIAFVAVLAVNCMLSTAQTPTSPLPANPPATAAEPNPSATGEVIFSRDATTPPAPQTAAPPNPTTSPDALAVTLAERTALTFTAYDLDLHLAPASAGISVRAAFTVRNDGPTPLPRIVLQISSSLHWDSFSSIAPSASVTPIPFASHSVETDADHTGAMQEAVLTLPTPLARGASLHLIALYSGSIPPSAARLERIGAPADQAAAADWDAIAPADSNGLTGGTALRGFGNVLWYPVSSPPVFLGDGAKFFQAVGAAKLRQSDASVRLRLAVDYIGDPPDAVFFCGRRAHLIAISDNPDLPAAESPGVATAEFDPRPLGFRTPDLFLTAAAPTIAGTAANSDLIAAVTGHYDALPAYAAAATDVEPLLTDWLGPQPLTPLTILDHPGQPYEDDALLLHPLRAVDPKSLDAPLVHSLTHAWVRSGHAWIDEGLAEFMSLLWIERTQGRPALVTQMEDSARTLALVEPEVPPDTPSSNPYTSFAQTSSSSPGDHPATGLEGRSLAEATGEVFYRTKAAAVWWMLRTLVGDDALKQALQAYRQTSSQPDSSLDRDPEGLERTVEKFAHKDLRWFFNDWVYRDRGLPDLSILSVTPSQLDTHAGQPAGWLVAVVVRNDGYAVADVPVTVRSNGASETQRLRIPGQSTASTRIVFAGTPDRIDVNDGTVPESQTCIHTRQLVLPTH